MNATSTTNAMPTSRSATPVRRSGGTSRMIGYEHRQAAQRSSTSSSTMKADSRVWFMKQASAPKDGGGLCANRAAFTPPVDPTMPIPAPLPALRRGTRAARAPLRLMSPARSVVEPEECARQRWQALIVTHRSQCVRVDRVAEQHCQAEARLDRREDRSRLVLRQATRHGVLDASSAANAASCQRHGASNTTSGSGSARSA